MTIARGAAHRKVVWAAAVVFPAFALPGRDFEYVIAAWGVCFVLLVFAVLAESSALPSERKEQP